MNVPLSKDTHSYFVTMNNSNDVLGKKKKGKKMMKKMMYCFVVLSQMAFGEITISRKKKCKKKKSVCKKNKVLHGLSVLFLWKTLYFDVINVDYTVKILPFPFFRYCGTLYAYWRHLLENKRNCEAAPWPELRHDSKWRMPVWRLQLCCVVLFFGNVWSVSI